MADWIAGIAAALSVAFGIISWWRSNESQAARDAADAARATAEKRADAAERTANELELLVEQVRGPALTLDLPAEADRAKPLRYLTNHRPETLRLLDLVNGDEAGPVAGLDLPLEIPPHGHRPVKLPRGHAHPAHWVIEVEGLGVVHVPVR